MSAAACALTSRIRSRRRRHARRCASMSACCPRACGGAPASCSWPWRVRRQHRPAEIELLARLFDLLGLEQAEVYSQVHALGD